jgi:uncharacterized protein YndB with AHSA1/START domain
MSVVVGELITATTPRNVFNVLTRQDQIAGWWTDDLNVKPEGGSLAEIRFRQGVYRLQFEIAELEAGQKVTWVNA